MKETLYKLFALFALSAALGLGLITLHFALGEADITVIVNQIPKNISADISIPIADTQELAMQNQTALTADETGEQPESQLMQLRKAVLGTSTEKPTSSKLAAQIKTITVFAENSFSPKGEGTAIDDYAEGVATIYNEQSVNQPLIAKTRLQAPDGSIFRMQTPITAPAQGEIDVLVKADKKGAEFNLEPTEFIIPGLTPAKQKLVYAKNKTAFTGGTQIIRTLTEDDFIFAKKEIEDLLKEQARTQFNAQNIAATSKNIILDPILFKTEDSVGEEKSELKISGETLANAVLFDEQTLYSEMQNRLKASIAKEEEIIGFNDASFVYTINSLDKASGSVQVNSYIEGFTLLKKDGGLISPPELAGLTKKQIQTKLLSYEGISEVRVNFSPFWLTRAPRIAGKIYITVMEAGK